ncbi:MAG: right-handed parallel beta-helix repeat-containing protein, partial [Trebonia sp.]
GETSGGKAAISMTKRPVRGRWPAMAAAILTPAALLLTALAGCSHPAAAPAPSPQPARVPGQAYEVCNEQAQYLTSPWTYDGLASGSRGYTVSQYKALPGYGKTLPPLPSYIAGMSPTTKAAVIYAPGSTVIQPAYTFPETPLLYFFEGGKYGKISFQTVSGDQFIGGSARGYPEPAFDDGGAAAGIEADNATYGFSGGAGTLASSAAAGATTVKTQAPISGYVNWLSFTDGTIYPISKASGTTITLGLPLKKAERGGALAYGGRQPPIARVSAAARQGATSVTLSAAATPLVRYASVVIGADSYTVEAVSGQQGSYSLSFDGRLDFPVAAGTPVYDGALAGNVSVEYLDISRDLHVSTGTIYTGAGWTITHNNIHDGYAAPGYGVAIYGGDQGTIQYNCLSRMGDYGVNLFGADSRFDNNEIYESNYRKDPGCGCSGGGKWWGTLNADIVDNAFVNDSPGGGVPIWLDNGNSGTLISGNYFYKSYSSAILSETGFNLDVTGNLFLDGGWGKGSGGCGDNCDGAVNLNSSGGFDVAGSRYENKILVSKNQFMDNWEGIGIWQAGARSCENSGEGWPNDADYCSGGYPNSAATASGGQYYFSHVGDKADYGTTSLAESAKAGSSTILVAGASAIHDQIGFGDPASTKTTDRTDVAALTGSGTIKASTAGFPAAGELRVGTSTAWNNGGGSYTGAILSYTGITPAGFTGVSLIRGSGTLAGPVREVQPYKVTAEKCYANDCAVTISPPLASPATAGATISNAGTCQLFATSAALPSGPLAPDGISYWDGCQWEAKDIAVTGNDFQFSPSAIASGAPLTGGGTTTSCTAANADSCGTNFMAFQVSGEAPFDTQVGANAMMSASSFTTCPAWDDGCAAKPLANLNAATVIPGMAQQKAERPADNVWSNNTYGGHWGWYAYLYGTCTPAPTDPVTKNDLPSSACGIINFSAWQSDWRQDVSSTYSVKPAAGRS